MCNESSILYFVFHFTIFYSEFIFFLNMFCYFSSHDEIFYKMNYDFKSKNCFGFGVEKCGLLNNFFFGLK